MFVNIIPGSWAIHGQQGVEAIRTFHTLSSSNWGAVHSVHCAHCTVCHTFTSAMHTVHTEVHTVCQTQKCDCTIAHTFMVSWVDQGSRYVPSWANLQRAFPIHLQKCKQYPQYTRRWLDSWPWSVTIGQLLLSGHSINSCQGILDNSLTTGHLKDRERPATMRCFLCSHTNLHFQFVHGQRLFWQASIFGSVLGEWYRSRCIGQLQTWGGLGLYGSYGCKLGLYCAVAEKWKQLSNIQHISSHWSYNRNPLVSCKAYHHITRGT